MTRSDHPIAVAAHPGLVRVVVAGTVVAESRAALALQEAGYPPVLYLPRGDVLAAHLRPSARRSHCPHKGEARYHDLVVGETVRRDAAWSYETPLHAVRAIAGHLAFYPERVDAITQEP